MGGVRGRRRSRLGGVGRLKNGWRCLAVLATRLNVIDKRTADHVDGPEALHGLAESVEALLDLVEPNVPPTRLPLPGAVGCPNGVKTATAFGLPFRPLCGRLDLRRLKRGRTLDTIRWMT